MIFAVAPRMGAWIEITKRKLQKQPAPPASLPVWAWIEITSAKGAIPLHWVAPRMGAWSRGSGADGYSVYVQYCGKDFSAKSLNQVKSSRAAKRQRLPLKR